jgi:hypothetical protein
MKGKLKTMLESGTVSAAEIHTRLAPPLAVRRK